MTILNVPLPDRDDLKTRLATISGSENINPDLEKYLIDSALGMTIWSRFSIPSCKGKSGFKFKDASRIIANEKEQIIKKSGILDYYQVNEDLEKRKVFWGIISKTWLKQRSKAFERKAKILVWKSQRYSVAWGGLASSKSLMAKCVATEWKQPLLRLDIGRFSGRVGSSENKYPDGIATAEAVMCFGLMRLKGS